MSGNISSPLSLHLCSVEDQIYFSISAPLSSHYHFSRQETPCASKLLYSRIKQSSPLPSTMAPVLLYLSPVSGSHTMAFSSWYFILAQLFKWQVRYLCFRVSSFKSLSDSFYRENEDFDVFIAKHVSTVVIKLTRLERLQCTVTMVRININISFYEFPFPIADQRVRRKHYSDTEWERNGSSNVCTHMLMHTCKTYTYCPEEVSSRENCFKKSVFT